MTASRAERRRAARVALYVPVERTRRAKLSYVPVLSEHGVPMLRPVVTHTVTYRLDPDCPRAKRRTLKEMSA